jgi:hypothetical protein
MDGCGDQVNTSAKGIREDPESHESVSIIAGSTRILARDHTPESVKNYSTLSPGQNAASDTPAVSAKALPDIPQIADAIEKGVTRLLKLFHR